MSKKTRGVVKWWNDELGYGFVSLSEGNECFAHFKNISEKGHKCLFAGQEIDLYVEETSKGLIAKKIKYVKIKNF